MNKINTLAFVNFLLVKLFPTMIRQNFPPLKICAVRYDKHSRGEVSRLEQKWTFDGKT